MEQGKSHAAFMSLNVHRYQVLPIRESCGQGNLSEKGVSASRNVAHPSVLNQTGQVKATRSLQYPRAALAVFVDLLSPPGRSNEKSKKLCR
eukprot:6030673-Amphidinium_carterae.1